MHLTVFTSQRITVNMMVCGSKRIRSLPADEKARPDGRATLGVWVGVSDLVHQVSVLLQKSGRLQLYPLFTLPLCFDAVVANDACGRRRTS